jgi:hypothetical protein
VEPDPQIESWGVTVRKSLGLPLFGPAQSPARAAVAALDRNVTPPGGKSCRTPKLPVRVIQQAGAGSGARVSLEMVNITLAHGTFFWPAS